ncbi:hypothetical protein FOE78_20580 [Microlunatus elymi]|uniref:SnoaL-like domain-containing protein n=1 Tax=Microlunatus elymi TaxID=2596828 RepID=A0A516Q3J3_9ACTN|nr:hypothetical protein [Microlunatus elymi]QDP97978.1 hypothetical protein FOE78_20580 [Microlunatus elymi]
MNSATNSTAGTAASPMVGATAIAQTDTDDLVAALVDYLESGTQQGIFAPDVFADVTFPRWRIQTATAEDLLRLRSDSHPHPGRVRVERVDRLDDGFVIAFEERWSDDAESWYARELIRADVVDHRICELSIYCTGDWDSARRSEHDRQVTLIRP